MTAAADAHPLLTWTEDGCVREARWRSEAGVPPPKRVQLADDTLNADAAYKLICEGTALLWRGDYHNGRLLLQALARRVDRKKRSSAKGSTLAEAFHQQRQAQGQRTRLLNMLLLSFEAGHVLPLRRAPEVAQACAEAWGEAEAPYVVSLRELLGAIGAHEWRRKGVEVQPLGARIHPHYAVFSPVRGEYLELVAKAPLPPGAEQLAFDIGTGTGVLAALLARRGVARVLATDCSPRALACARDNIERLNFGKRVEVLEADLFPEGEAPLVVCNPPWVPARPMSTLDAAVYDPDSAMLKGFLGGLAAHLTPKGEGWLILSDLAERLGLREAGFVEQLIAAGGLKVVGRLDARPRHGKAFDKDDPLHAARAAEITTLWRLRRVE